MTKEEKKFQRKVIALCSNIKRCNPNDLVLFVALCIIRFDVLDAKNDKHNAKLDDSSHFETAVELSYTLNAEDNIHYLLS